ncbi:hypothetical protein BCV70DRAFT_198854 [Testicularia cyperi]|uniref:FAD-binding FR-type domain-containing protein n=1 Tax=Testicularia cyperi TaxID=1882483 RepID=A0A317XVT6_9BASI|nr:hypothetical protein BCV70DRAFT_198854 [Testicularia cyperi]
MTNHEWHAGELYVQSRLGFKDAVAGAHSIFRPQLTSQHQSFHTSLDVLPVCTLDAHGRPWGSFLASKDGQSRFIQSSSFNNLVATNLGLHPSHPLTDSLARGVKVGMNGMVLDKDSDSHQGPALRLIAGVGVMFDNRRRNKFAGFINDRAGIKDGLVMEVMESLGNCPKYINTRHLVPRPDHTPSVIFDRHTLPPDEQLPQRAVEHIAQADAVFLSTRYIAPEHTIFKSHLGINIRGGKPGFVRHSTDPASGRPVLCFPDYSGNRFMSSLGNIHSDKVAGLTIPRLRKGLPIDVLYLTGDAQVLLDDDAAVLFPGVKAAVRIVVTGCIFVEDALPLVPAEFEEDDFEPKDNGIGWSPYNPPVRRLRSEIVGKAGDDSTASQPMSSTTAELVKLDRHTDELATLTFKTSAPIRYHAGQHVILDCSSIVDPHLLEYQHMAEKMGGEREINDTGIRTWTISSSPSDSNNGFKTDVFSITMRKVFDGNVTPRLFAIPSHRDPSTIKLPILGIGGDFLVAEPDQSPSTHQLWFAQGIGITPFLSFLRSFAHSTSPTKPIKIDFLLSCRPSEVETMLSLIQAALQVDGRDIKDALDNISLSLHVFARSQDQAASPESPFPAISVVRYNTRLQPDSVQSLLFNPTTQAWICGTPAYEQLVFQAFLPNLAQDKIHRESFNY